MPYSIVKLPNGQWAKKRRDTGKIVSRHATREKAVGSALAVMHAEGIKGRGHELFKKD